jgi:thymidylate synthase
MKQYLDLLSELQSAVIKDNRTGISAASKFFHTMEFDIAKNGFPAVTTKKLAIKAVVGECLGFLRASSNSAEFEALKCKVWTDNANNHNLNPDGSIKSRNPWLSNPFRKGENDLGRVYGVQWRDWDHTTYLSKADLERMGKDIAGGIEIVTSLGYENYGFLADKQLYVFRKKVDQVKWALEELVKNPLNRRILITGWNPGDLDKMCLPPCHLLQHWQCMPMSIDDRINYGIENIGELFTLPRFNSRVEKEEKEAELSKVCDLHGIPKYTLNLMMYQR